MTNIFPVLRYRDAESALDFLKKAFGFEEKVVYRSEDGSVGHAELQLGGAGMIMFSPAKEDNWMGGHALDPLASPVSVYIAVDDPEAHFERAKAEGANIVRGLEKMDYGSTEYSARDPEGNLWSFGTYDPNAALA
jgi:uncharacterized glyoxalase superfamily protein PhnB